MNKFIEEQLKKVEKADLSHFNEDTNTYFIPKRVDIKLTENECYLLHLKDSFFRNEVVKNNWNGGTVPKNTYLKADISKILAKMIKVVSIGYDEVNNKDLPSFWSGWLSIEDIEVLEKL